MLKVQEYLCEFSSRNTAIQSLIDTYHIGIGEYTDDLVVLNYDQIDSPRFHPLVDECRGLILSYDFKQIYSRPYTRFYNFGEGQKNLTFDFLNSKIFEKIDGSLISMNFHPVKNIWFVSTRKLAYAEGMNVFNKSYRNTFMRALGLDGDISDIEFTDYINRLIDAEYRKYTFIFELTSPETRVVKRYSEYMNYLTGVRDKTIFDNNTYQDITKFHKFFKGAVKLPKIYSFATEDDIKKSVKELTHMDEGYVCFNEHTEERVKVKSSVYVAIHHLRSNGQINPKKIVVLVFENEYEEYLAYFEEDRQFFEPYIKAHALMIKEVSEYFNIYGDMKSQKEFALAINDLPFSSILFSMRNGEKLHDVLDKMPNDRKLYTLELFIDNKWKTLINKNNKKKK